jgi:hypothetical protein
MLTILERFVMDMRDLDYITQIDVFVTSLLQDYSDKRSISASKELQKRTI